MSSLAIAVAIPTLTPAELVKARDYLYGGLAWGVIAQLWTLALLALAYYSGASARLTRSLQRRHSPGTVTAAVTLVLFAWVLVASLPLDAYLGFWRERAFGFLHLTLAAWMLQWAESALLTSAVGLAVVAIAYVLLRRWRRRASNAWWLRLWALVMVCAVFGVAAEPIFVEPLFNHFTAVHDAGVRARIAALAARAGIPAAHIYEMDASRQTGHTNAYVVGILGSQRIVVYDTLLRSQSPAEVDFVIGHEIGHYVLHHLWKGLGFTAVFLLTLFWLLSRLFPRFARPGDAVDSVAALPLLLLLLLGLLYLSAPITNGFSRWEEHQADAFGLRLTQDPCAAVASFEREEKTDLIYPDPPAWIVCWFFNHPSQQQRIDYAQSQGCPR